MLATPLRAIKLKCYDCSAWNRGEVVKCVHNTCILWPYRLGKHPKGQKPSRVSPEAYKKLITASK